MAIMFEKMIVLFSDGAAKGNPGPGGWGVVIATPEGKVKELGGGGLMVTNNQMELLGVIEGLKYLRTTKGDVAVFTDSAYVLHGITAWVFGWLKKGWKTKDGGEVANSCLWIQLHELVSERKKKNLGKFNWGYTPGHAGVPGNERVDEIASTYAHKRKPDLYSGPLLKYDVPLYDLPDNTSIPEMKFDHTKREKKKAHSYLSLVNGDLEIHKTWPECEARVKGRSGARFKKAMSPADESKIKKDWGV